ncbi:helix-turn-helix domain-containing protein [Psychromonas antarctica]|jgi:hypothetical protein|uniref:helix-turn-helix domain-containing protein n=1 Tax=Psychromonas antarctica TaxID=67573 RepID=UPI001EE82C8D|nr:helix-turn-helix domain-containing protein [Psychromonas antarctica]MCG6201377.1 winged helix-turn-helix domain-containing protein [Psychromonas antarctica]
MIDKQSKTKTAYYRRLLVAYLIDTGVNTPPLILGATGMARRTLQDTIKALAELDIECVDTGGTINKSYSIKSWGAINSSWIEDNLEQVKDVLGLLSKEST